MNTLYSLESKIQNLHKPGERLRAAGGGSPHQHYHHHTGPQVITTLHKKKKKCLWDRKWLVLPHAMNKAIQIRKRRRETLNLKTSADSSKNTNIWRRKIYPFTSAVSAKCQDV